MSYLSTEIDYGGARGSNAGDQFHENWALLQVINLLNPKKKIKAVSVEGVKTDTISQNGDHPTWNGVDCTLYYGGTTLESADQIEFIQLKYSSAMPDKAWTLSRLTQNSGKQKNNSIIRKFANEFKNATTRMKSEAKLIFKFISNQAVSEEIRKAFQIKGTDYLQQSGIEEKTKNIHDRLRKPSGLSHKDYQSFLDIIDFNECNSPSRFAIREKLVFVVTDFLGDNVLSEMNDLQVRIRELMLPERSNEIVTERTVLSWFGFSCREGLFPCPSDIEKRKYTVKRLAIDDVIKLLDKDEKLILIHGEGGAGKTTLMCQIAAHLPKDSQTIFFDCFAGGRYIYSDDKRHLPENAFLHMINEIAVSLNLPLFIPRSRKNPATIKLFLSKLATAGNLLAQISSPGKLVINIDAADNSIVAANAAVPHEQSFVFDLLRSSLSSLPSNVHIIISCRTARKDMLSIPYNTPEVHCSSFSIQETREHLKINSFNSDESLVETFHHLSNANPRVQYYAIDSAQKNQRKLIETLLPGGKNLSDILKPIFDKALN
jgi:energy-coupling factor transporter ATP-binding protein EcfA2